MRTWIAAAALLAATSAFGAHPDETRRIEFPNTKDGMQVLAVDPHTHSVFSDGHVWPTARVWEAVKDDLDAFMVTEHLEYQPHIDDIPHPDRNRAFNVAKEHAERYGFDTLVINGAEITRDLPPGHINAVFIEDANALMVDDARGAIEAARAQGAFVFWNHSWWPRDFPNGIVTLTDMHRRLIADNLLNGIEVANGDYASDEAFQIALDNNLGIIGVSDIHGLVDYQYDMARGGHRTVTLTLASARSGAAIKEAFEARRTVALYRHTLLGREAHVKAIVEGALSLEKGAYVSNSTILNVTIKNGSSSPFILKNTGEATFNGGGNLITVPPRGEAKIAVNDVENKDALALEFEVVNAFIAPRRNFVHTLR